MSIIVRLLATCYIIQGCVACVVPLPLDFFYPEEGERAVVGGNRVRREVSLGDRRNCERGDEQPPNRVDTRQRVNDLIQMMNDRALDAYIVPSEDAHQSEYVADFDKRRAFISGFSGSAGTAVVLASGQRALWTDGRYFLEAEDQLDCDWLLMKSKQEGVPTMMEWLKDRLEAGQKVGVDPYLVGAVVFEEYQKELNQSGIVLVPENTNLVDLVWSSSDRPERRKDHVYVLEQKFAGRSWTDKVKDVWKVMREKKVDLLVITALDEVAWLLNLRGHDIPYNPVFRSYVLMDLNRVILFLPSDRITPRVDLHLHINTCMEGVCLDVTAYENLVARLQSMSDDPSVKRVLLPKKYAYSGGASYAVYSAVPAHKRVLEPSPVLEMKARKNEIEFEGMRKAHIKDAVALIDFLALLEKEMEDGSEDWDELMAVERVAQFRSQQEDYVSPSFSTISAYGPNGAIIHYKPTNVTNKKLARDSLFLLDSGGQYKDGTTDVTRTLHFGTPTEFEKEAYTRVLMGAIDLASLVFPKGTGDASVDVLARRYLYQVGLDYLHGTGHGIGMFLNIHESPTQVRIYGKENHKFELGHFFSDEPGYYKSGQFGIRLETIIAVVEADTKYKSEKEYYRFEPITLVPFEPKLIQVELLNAEQCDYLNDYQTKVREIIGPELEKQGRYEGLQYMKDKTEHLNCNAPGMVQATRSPLGSSSGGVYSSGCQLHSNTALLAAIFLVVFMMWI